MPEAPTYEQLVALVDELSERNAELERVVAELWGPGRARADRADGRRVRAACRPARAAERLPDGPLLGSRPWQLLTMTSRFA